MHTLHHILLYSLTALLEIINISTALLESFDLLFFVTFNGGEEHFPQMPLPKLGILLIIIV